MKNKLLADKIMEFFDTRVELRKAQNDLKLTRVFVFCSIVIFSSVIALILI